MLVLAEIQVIPIGEGVSVRSHVQRAHNLIAESGLKVQAHAFGTNVEGELTQVLAVIERLHETLHAEGITRLTTAVKIGSRMDKPPRLADKKLDSPPRSG